MMIMMMMLKDLPCVNKVTSYGKGALIRDRAGRGRASRDRACIREGRLLGIRRLWERGAHKGQDAYGSRDAC